MAWVVAQFRRPRFCSVQAAKTERRQLQCDRGSGSVGHRLATSPRSQPAPAALVWRQPHGSRNKGAVSRLPGRVGETAALWHQAWKAVHVWMQEASSTQIFYGLAPQPNCSGAAHDLKVIKEDVGEDRRRRHGAWVWQALVANCQRTYSRIGVVGRTDRMRLSVSVKGYRQAFFATDASEVGVGSASALSKIPLQYS